ncbi:hypothetical protein G6F50_014554 [Rhizopus delemar]|uniref:Response regulatory domain-containing protein n=1 Tax=Rhizopus delemar TaxID=936053 RepID=A0A9P7C6W9_9FUNG|nr:hypothetical protein G6F50_014554 [Rhizopus delemar]
MTTLLIADDHPLYIDALRGLIGRLYPNAVIRDAEEISVLYGLVQAKPHADLLLLDLNMPGATGFDTLTQVLRLRPQLPVAIVSAHDDPLLMRRAIDHGAMGFIPKSANADTIGRALRQAAGRKAMRADAAARPGPADGGRGAAQQADRA